MMDGIPTTEPLEAPMTTAVSTANQLRERVAGVADAAAIPTYRVTARLTVDGTKLYASVMCYRESAAEELVFALRREATAEFGEQGAQLTVRREGPHVQVFLPVPKPDAQRGAQFLSSLATPKTEF